MPVRAWRSRAMRSTISSVTFWTLAAMSQWNSSILDSGSRRGCPKSFVEALVGHRQAVVVREVLHVQLERAVLAQVDEVLEDLVVVLRLAVRRGAHHLVLGAVDLEAEVVGEGAVEQAERVREADLAGAARARCRARRPAWRSPTRRRRRASGSPPPRTGTAGRPTPRATGGARRRAPRPRSRAPARSTFGTQSFSFSQTGIALVNDGSERGKVAR